MNSTIIFLSILIVFLSVMLIIKIDIYIDIFSLIVRINIKIYNVKIIQINFNISEMYYQVNHSKNRKKISLILDENEKFLINQIKKNILDKLYYDNFMMSTLINFEDPYTTTIFVGFLNELSRLIKCLLVTKYENLDIKFFHNANFINNSNYIKIATKVYFTIFDMVFAIILSFYRRGKYVKQKK